MTAQPERRFLPSAPPAVVGRNIKGLAARFNSRSENLGTADRPVFEIIAPGAFDDVLSDDVICSYNHDESAILARSTGGKGTLKLSVDQVGLTYEFAAPDNTAGNDLLESLKRGDIRGSSFAFQVAEGGDSFTQEPGGVLRTITKIGKLHDVSPVVRPAYKNTDVDARSLSAPQEPASLPRWEKLFEILS